MSVPLAPTLPDLTGLTDCDKLTAIQDYILQFEYNYTGRPFLKLKKRGGANYVNEAAQRLIKLSLPIQCVEAVFIASFLTGANLESVDRLPLNFKSVFRGVTHRHIVLAVRLEEKWGAIGISRRDCLMKKKINFDSLTDLIQEFESSYRQVFHTLVTVYIGLPFPHDCSSTAPIKWKSVKICGTSNGFDQMEETVNTFCENMRTLRDDYYFNNAC